jgi:hypothetical protein
MAQSPTIEFNEAAIFSRCLETQHLDLSPELATHILALRLSAKDQQRIDELLPKAQSGILTAEERKELEALNHVADLLSLWHSIARRSLNRQPVL